MMDLFEMAPTFDDPIGMLRACHRRLERALLVMARVPFIGTRSGAGAGLVVLIVVAVALALDAGRLRRRAAEGSTP